MQNHGKFKRFCNSGTMGNSEDFAIAGTNINPYFENRSPHCFLHRNKMNSVRNSDKISVLANTMACVGGLGETAHGTMDSEAADGRFKYLSILISPRNGQNVFQR